MSTIASATNSVAGAGCNSVQYILPNLIIFLILQSNVMNIAHSGIK